MKRFVKCFFELLTQNFVTIHSRFDGTTNKAEL